MDSARIYLKLVFDRLGLTTDLGTFAKRLAIQKRIYLAQLFGVDLGYRFGWYLRGPYCPELTSDAFTLRDEVQGGDDEADDYALQEQDDNRLEKANRLCVLPNGMDVDVTEQDWLELLASLHYLRHIAYRPGASSNDFESVFDSLTKWKPRFASMSPQSRAAWKRLDEFGLIASKTIG
jgi:hypothetical protein